MQDNSIDITAKLLANENLNVIRSNVSTASFNIKNRTLILPQWKNMTPEVDQMLVAHEVSHALFTPIEYVDSLKTTLKFNGAQSYLNILEDIRVEKLMKRRYAGIRKTFAIGYQQLNDMDFFGVSGRDMTHAHLMDRINLYFKAGYKCGVTFSKDEKVFVTRAENTENLQDVVQLAQDIYDYLLAKQETRDVSTRSSNNNDDFENNYDDSDDESDDSDDDSDDSDVGDDNRSDDSNNSDESNESDNTQSSTGSGKGGELDNSKDVKKPTTDSIYQSRINELADTETSYEYWTVAPVSYDPIITYREVLKRIGIVNSPYVVETTKTFMEDTRNNIEYMAKEFEMRKAATTYKRTTISKTGSLDMKKVWSYKLNEDIFKRVATVKQGKNHGMVFLLDWSGSMINCIEDTIDQVINLVMFCRQVNIPFQVFAFSDGTVPPSLDKDGNLENVWSKMQEMIDLNDKNKVVDVSCRVFSMIEMFSNKMSKSELNQMVLALKSDIFRQRFFMQSTPLNEALVFMYQYIERFQKMNNVEKLSFVTLTDGDGGGLPVSNRMYRTDGEKTLNIRNYFKDIFSKKNIEFTSASSQTRGLLQMIKSRYNCTMIGFFVCRPKQTEIRSCIRCHYDGVDRDDHNIDRLISEMKSQGFTTLKGTGRDELFVIPSSSRIKTGHLEVSMNSTARSMAKQLGKYMTKKKTSRVLLNNVISYVA